MFTATTLKPGVVLVGLANKHASFLMTIDAAEWDALKTLEILNGLA